MSTTPKALRARNMTAAKRSATLIRDGILQHLEILAEGKIPESSFTASVAKYEASLVTLRALDALDGGDPAPDGEVLVRPGDLDVLLRLVRVQFGPDALAGDSPLGHLAAAAWPDGVPAAVAAPAPGQEG